MLKFILYRIIGKLLLKITGVSLKQKLELGDEKQVIIVANHNSHWDTLAIMATVPYEIFKNLKPVAAGDYFAGKGLKRWVTNNVLDLLLIPRKRKGDVSPLDQVRASLKSGKSILIFPEGTRGESEIMQDLKPGAAKLASEFPQIKVVPVQLEGMGKILPKGAKLPVPSMGSVKYMTYIKGAGETVESIMQLMRNSIEPQVSNV